MNSENDSKHTLTQTLRENTLNGTLRGKVCSFQKNEITEHYIYHRLAQGLKHPENSKVLDAIARDEYRHYEFWKKYTRRDVKPNRWQLFKYYWISRLFGITFGIKLMERGEQSAQEIYREVGDQLPGVAEIMHDEDRHEHELICMIDEERLKYVGSIVLGLNDALVELTGTLAGLTFALQNTRLIALVGLITGIAASFSMAASEFLSTKTEEGGRSPLTSSFYTGIAYILTVLFLVFPYLLFSNYFICLLVTIINALVVIAGFNYYVSVAKGLSFRRRFAEMASISMGVAAFSFVIGYVIRIFLGIDV
jgi:VIT1/CCC1 family predicted Fe2+/Mn2+ transporter